MGKRLMLAGALAALLTLMLGSPAMAGGWAVTTFDDILAEFEAGTSYNLEYTVLRHGEHPISLEGTAVRIWSPETGEEHVFSGQMTGEEGVHSVEVTFPSSGVWEWEVQPGWFPEQHLGSLSVAEAETSSAAGTTVSQAGSGPTAYQIVLPAAAGVQALIFALQGYWLLRDRRQRSTTPAAAGAGD